MGRVTDHDCIAANYYKFLVIIRNFFRNYESTNCSLKVTNFKFSAQQKKPLIKYHLMSIWVKSRITIVKKIESVPIPNIFVRVVCYNK